MGTYSARPSEVERRWWLIDAEDLVLGRLAVITANHLRGKYKAMYTPNIDCGDHVVIVNAEKIALTGKKRSDKTYYRHTGYPGGLKETTAGKVLDGKTPGRVIEKAVQRMVPKGPLGRAQLKKLHVYAGAEHPHAGQSPELLDIGGLNSKNSVAETANG